MPPKKEAKMHAMAKRFFMINLLVDLVWWLAGYG